MNNYLKLNVLPEGVPAWLNYSQYSKLKQKFEAVDLPSEDDGLTADEKYLELHHFLVDIGGLQLPANERAIHFNAFAMLRRGYQVEEITEYELETLERLMDELYQPSIDDMDLHPAGRHRALYDYLTGQMGLFVEPGRGSAWHRAYALIEKAKAEQQQPVLR